MEADEELASATTRPLTMVVKTVWEIPLKLESAVLSALVSEEVESVLLRGPSRATNSRTIFLVFTNSRTTEGLRVSLFFAKRLFRAAESFYKAYKAEGAGAIPRRNFGGFEP